MTSTNDGKDVKSSKILGQKAKTYYIELYKTLEARLSVESDLGARTSLLCEAWRRVHCLCQQSASATHPHLISWLQRHTAQTLLQSEWRQLSINQDKHDALGAAIDFFILECQEAIITRRGANPQWETQLLQRAEWFKSVIPDPWGNAVLKALLDRTGEAPSDQQIVEWLKEERGVFFVTRLRQLASSKKTVDIALSLATAVMERVRACAAPRPDAAPMNEAPEDQTASPTFTTILTMEAGFTVDVWELITDIEFVLLYSDRSKCIALAKQTPLKNGYQLVERLHSRLDISSREKRLWKNAKDVAILIAQVMIARCMVVPTCIGTARSTLYGCSRSLVKLLPAERLPASMAALAAPAVTARHLHTLAVAVDAQCKNERKAFVCELYIRAITAGMNELERLKHTKEKESEARLAEKLLGSWFTALGSLLGASARLAYECALTAFSLHPSPSMYERIRTAPQLQPAPPIHKDVQEPMTETNSEFGSWATDSRTQTNFVKTSETLNLKKIQQHSNVLSTAILNEGEGLGLSPELCQDLIVLLSGPRVKTLSWDMDKEILIENCRSYMERTHGGTRALTTELKYLNLDPDSFRHLPEEQDEDETDIYYGIEKGYEHLVELQEPEEIWEDALSDPERTESCYSTENESFIPISKGKKKEKLRRYSDSVEEALDPLSDTVPQLKHRSRSSENNKPLKDRCKDLLSDILSKPKNRSHSNESKSKRTKERTKDRSKDRIKKEGLTRDRSNSTGRSKNIKGSENNKNNIEENQNNPDVVKLQEKPKKERKKREKKDRKELVKHPALSGVSRLVGKKIIKTNILDMQKFEINQETETDFNNQVFITDSDYDSQGKSSITSVPLEGNDPDVLFDGLFSMDDIKSVSIDPLQSSNQTSSKSMALSVDPLKNVSQDHCKRKNLNDTIQVTSNVKIADPRYMQKDVKDNELPRPSSATVMSTKSVKNTSQMPWSRLNPSQNETSDEVKLGIKRLLEFRKQKSATDLVSGTEHEFELENQSGQNNTDISPAIKKNINKFDHIAMTKSLDHRSRILSCSPKSISVPDIPKVFINKNQSLQSNNLKHEIDSHIFNQVHSMEAPVYPLNNLNKPVSRPVTQQVANKSDNNQKYNRSAYINVNNNFEEKIFNLFQKSESCKVLNASPVQEFNSNSKHDGVIKNVSNQNNLQDFLKELHRSNNAGLSTDNKRPSGVKINKESLYSTSVKQIKPSKKVDIAPNTFARLKYMHKNKQCDNISKQNNNLTQNVLPNYSHLQTIRDKNDIIDSLLSRVDGSTVIRKVHKSPQKKIDSSKKRAPADIADSIQSISKKALNKDDKILVKSNPLQSKSTPSSMPTTAQSSTRAAISTEDKFVMKSNLLHLQPTLASTLTSTQSTRTTIFKPRTVTDRDENSSRYIIEQKHKYNLTKPLLKTEALKYKEDIKTNSSPLPVISQTKDQPCADEKYNRLRGSAIALQPSHNLQSLPKNTVTSQENSPNITKAKSTKCNIRNKLAAVKTKESNANIKSGIKNDIVQQDWESVLNDLLSHKTPCRSMNAQSITMTKDKKEMTSSSSCGQSYDSFTSINNINHNVTAASNIKRNEEKDKNEITVKNKPVNQQKPKCIMSVESNTTSINNTPFRNNYMRENISVINEPLTLKPNDIHLLRKSNQTVVMKTYSKPPEVKLPSGSLKKDLNNSVLQMHVEPTMSDVTSSEYDILAELMDDDLRQEIGEISSDEDCFSGANVITKGKDKNIISSKLINFVRSSSDDSSFDVSSRHNQCISNKKDNSILRSDGSKNEHSVRPFLTDYESRKHLYNTVYINDTAKCHVEMQNVKTCNAILQNPKPVMPTKLHLYQGQQFILNNKDSTHQSSVIGSRISKDSMLIEGSVQQSNDCSNQDIVNDKSRRSAPVKQNNTNVSQHPMVKNVVLIRPEIVYEPYTVEVHPIQETNSKALNVNTNTFLSINAVPTISMFSSQFPNPAVNPLIISNAITVPISKSSTSLLFNNTKNNSERKVPTISANMNTELEKTSNIGDTTISNFCESQNIENNIPNLEDSSVSVISSITSNSLKDVLKTNVRLNDSVENHFEVKNITERENTLPYVIRPAKYIESKKHDFVESGCGNNIRFSNIQTTSYDFLPSGQYTTAGDMLHRDIDVKDNGSALYQTFENNVLANVQNLQQRQVQSIAKDSDLYNLLPSEQHKTASDVSMCYSGSDAKGNDYMLYKKTEKSEFSRDKDNLSTLYCNSSKPINIHSKETEKCKYLSESLGSSKFINTSEKSTPCHFSSQCVTEDDAVTSYVKAGEKVDDRILSRSMVKEGITMKEEKLTTSYNTHNVSENKTTKKTARESRQDNNSFTSTDHQDFLKNSNADTLTENWSTTDNARNLYSKSDVKESDYVSKTKFENKVLEKHKNLDLESLCYPPVTKNSTGLVNTDIRANNYVPNKADSDINLLFEVKEKPNLSIPCVPYKCIPENTSAECGHPVKVQSTTIDSGPHFSTGQRTLLAEIVTNSPKDLKLNDCILNKNCERKVLSEVQENHTTVLSDKIIKTFVGSEDELKKDFLKMREARVTLKKTAILNRQVHIYSNIDPIPLTYAPINTFQALSDNKERYTENEKFVDKTDSSEVLPSVVYDGTSAMNGEKVSGELILNKLSSSANISHPQHGSHFQSIYVDGSKENNERDSSDRNLVRRLPSNTEVDDTPTLAQKQKRDKYRITAKVTLKVKNVKDRKNINNSKVTKKLMRKRMHKTQNNERAPIMSAAIDMNRQSSNIPDTRQKIDIEEQLQGSIVFKNDPNLKALQMDRRVNNNTNSVQSNQIKNIQNNHVNTLPEESSTVIESVDKDQTSKCTKTKYFDVLHMDPLLKSVNTFRDQVQDELVLLSDDTNLVQNRDSSVDVQPLSKNDQKVSASEQDFLKLQKQEQLQREILVNKKLIDSYKDNIIIEELPRKKDDDPLKRCISIKLANGNNFKATVSGKLQVDIYSLFEDPAIRSMLMNNIPSNTRCILNIQQVNSASGENVRTRLVLPERKQSQLETINLISDDEEEPVSQVLNTEFGKYKVSNLKENIFNRHQKRLTQKCFVKIKKLDISSKEFCTYLLETNNEVKDTSFAIECVNGSRLGVSKVTNDIHVVNDTDDDKNLQIIEIDDSSKDSIDIIKESIDSIPFKSSDEIELNIKQLKETILQDLCLGIINETNKTNIPQLEIFDSVQMNLENLKETLLKDLSDDLGNTETELLHDSQQINTIVGNGLLDNICSNALSENAVVASSSSDKKNIESDVQNTGSITKSISIIAQNMHLDSSNSGRVVNSMQTIGCISSALDKKLLLSKCQLRIEKCDDLVKKYDILKGKRCFVPLQRCDKLINIYSDSENNTLKNINELDDLNEKEYKLNKSETISVPELHVSDCTLKRSGSLSILSEINIYDPSLKLLRSPEYNVSDKIMLDKRAIHYEHYVKHDDAHTCQSDWFMTKLEFHSKMKQIRQNNNVFDDISTDCDSDHDDNCSNVSETILHTLERDELPVELIIYQVPSLLQITHNFLADSNAGLELMNRMKSTNNICSFQHHMKRKLIIPENEDDKKNIKMDDGIEHHVLNKKSRIMEINDKTSVDSLKTFEKFVHHCSQENLFNDELQYKEAKLESNLTYNLNNGNVYTDVNSEQISLHTQILGKFYEGIKINNTLTSAEVFIKNNTVNQSSTDLGSDNNISKQIYFETGGITVRDNKFLCEHENIEKMNEGNEDLKGHKNSDTVFNMQQDDIANSNKTKKSDTTHETVDKMNKYNHIMEIKHCVSSERTNVSTNIDMPVSNSHQDKLLNVNTSELLKKFECDSSNREPTYLGVTSDTEKCRQTNLESLVNEESCKSLYSSKTCNAVEVSMEYGNENMHKNKDFEANKGNMALSNTCLETISDVNVKTEISSIEHVDSAKICNEKYNVEEHREVNLKNEEKHMNFEMDDAVIYSDNKDVNTTEPKLKFKHDIPFLEVKDLKRDKDSEQKESKQSSLEIIKNMKNRTKTEDNGSINESLICKLLDRDKVADIDEKKDLSSNPNCLSEPNGKSNNICKNEQSDNLELCEIVPKSDKHKISCINDLTLFSKNSTDIVDTKSLDMQFVLKSNKAKENISNLINFKHQHMQIKTCEANTNKLDAQKSIMNNNNNNHNAVKDIVQRTFENINPAVQNKYENSENVNLVNPDGDVKFDKDIDIELENSDSVEFDSRAIKSHQFYEICTNDISDVDELNKHKRGECSLTQMKVTMQHIDRDRDSSNRELCMKTIDFECPELCNEAFKSGLHDLTEKEKTNIHNSSLTLDVQELVNIDKNVEDSSTNYNTIAQTETSFSILTSESHNTINKSYIDIINDKQYGLVGYNDSELHNALTGPNENRDKTEDVLYNMHLNNSTKRDIKSKSSIVQNDSEPNIADYVADKCAENAENIFNKSNVDFPISNISNENTAIASYKENHGGIKEKSDEISCPKHITLMYESDSKVILKGSIIEDPIVGTCYVFPIINSDQLCQEINDDEDYIDHNETITSDVCSLFEDDLFVVKPKYTYSKTDSKFNYICKSKGNHDIVTRTSLKRKIDSMDSKINHKKYRKGKNIDYPKLTVAAVYDLAYSKEFKNLSDYCSSIKFSYSRQYHLIQLEDVHTLLKDWPIKDTNLSISNVSDTESNLFDDIEQKTLLPDPLMQTLAEEMLTVYDEKESTALVINETNFSMGFGERSGRVDQNFVNGKETIKISAVTLSDVKQSQPFLHSVIDDKPYMYEKHDSKDKQSRILDKYYLHIRLRNQVQTFFRKTSAELNYFWLKRNYESEKIKSNSKGFIDVMTDFPYDLNVPDFFEPPFVENIVQVVQVGQLPVSTGAQNPVTCDPRVTQVSDASPPQCSVENVSHDDMRPSIKTEYTELTTADISLSLMPDYDRSHQGLIPASQSSNLAVCNDNITIETEVKIEVLEDVPETIVEQNRYEHKKNPNFSSGHISNSKYTFEVSDDDVSIKTEPDVKIVFEPLDSNDDVNQIPETYELHHKRNGTHEKPDQLETYELQHQRNVTLEKPDQLAHAMSAAGITTSPEPIPDTAIDLSNSLSRNVCSETDCNNYQRSNITTMTLQQALAQILPSPINQTSESENSPQVSVSSQILHIVQGKNTSLNQITLTDTTQQSVISTATPTPVLHIVQSKNGPICSSSNDSAVHNSNSYTGLSLVDAGLTQGGNQLLHIVNTGNQKSNNSGQLLKRVNLLTNLTNVQGTNEQKMVQFVCKSGDTKGIQLNTHQRSMVLRLHTIESPQPVPSKPDCPDPGSRESPTKESTVPQELKSRSVYEENYAKFIQNSSKQPVIEKSTSLPKFNQAFGKPVFQEDNQKSNEIDTNGAHLSQQDANIESGDCSSTDGSLHLENIRQIASPPLLLRKSATHATAQQNLVQQIKQAITPMNIQTMHGGVIYTRQIPVNIGGGQTINLITVPSTERIEDSAQKQKAETKFGSKNEIEPSIIKIVPQSPVNSSSEISTDESNNTGGMSNESSQNSQAPPMLTQMRIKLPMISKNPQMVSGARVVRPSFFQIQRNVIGGPNQPVYQQLVLTAAPTLGQQTIRLPNTQTSREMKVGAESQTSSESQMSSSTLEQLREFDMVLEQVKERSTVQPNGTPTHDFSKSRILSTDTSDSTSRSTSSEVTQQVLYSIGNNQSVNVAYVNRKSTVVSTSATTSFARSPDSSGIVESPPSSSHTSSTHAPHTITSETINGTHPSQSNHKATKVSSKSKSRPKSHHPQFKINSLPPKPSNQKPMEDEQTTQRILYILAEYKEQVENSPDKDKPAPRRRTNLQASVTPPGGSKRKKSSSGSRRNGRDSSPLDDNCRTMGSEDSSCGTSQGDCSETCQELHSPQSSPRKVAKKLSFDQDSPTSQPRPQHQLTQQPPQPQQVQSNKQQQAQLQRNLLVTDGPTIAVTRATPGKPATAVLMPANYILPVSMVKSGQQIAIVTNRGPKILTVGGGEGGATNALLLQRLISPAGLKPMLARPGVRHVRLPTTALHNLQAFNLTTTASATPHQPPETVTSPVPATSPPDLIDTKAPRSPWASRDSEEVKPERGSSPDEPEQEQDPEPEPDPDPDPDPEPEPWNVPHDYSYEETVRTEMDRTVLDAIPDRYSPDMEAQRIFDKMFDVESKKGYIDSQDDSPRCPYDIDASDCDDKAYHQVVQRRDGVTNRHRFVSAATLRQKFALMEDELRLQKSLSEECEDLGVDSPSASDLFPEAELLFSSSPAHEASQQPHTPQPVILTQSIGISKPDLDDQAATDHLITREDIQENRHANEIDLGLEDVGIVTVSEDGMRATISLDHEEFVRSHPNTTFHSELTEEGEVQPVTLADLKARHITSTIFHAGRAPATVLVTAPQTTVISQATPDGSGVDHVRCSHADTINHDRAPGVTRFDILNDSRELHLSNSTSIIQSNATQVIRRVCSERDARYFLDDDLMNDPKMTTDDSRDATLESVDDEQSSPERSSELFWENTRRREDRRLDFSSDSDKCCKSPYDENNSTDSSIGVNMRLDSVIKDARGIDRSDSSVDDNNVPPLRTYPPKRTYHHDGHRSTSGKTKTEGRFTDSSEGRRRASNRGVVKRGCHCCNGTPAPSKPKKPRQRKPTSDFN